MKILLVETNNSLKTVIESMVARAGKKATVLLATTFKQAVKLIEENPDIKAVSLAGRFVNEYDPAMATTLKLIPFIREKLPGTQLIASSSDGLFMKQLMEDGGCDKAIDKFDQAVYIVGLVPNN